MNDRLNVGKQSSTRGLAERTQQIAHIAPAAIAIILAAYFITVRADSLGGWLTDDAFYYFDIARSIAATGQSTFDGIHLTNGYQPLWQMLLVPVFWVTDDPTTAIRAILIFQTILWASGLYLLAKLMRKLGFPATGAAIGALILAWPTFIGTFIGGMENALSLVAIVAFLIVSHNYQGGRSVSQNKTWLILGGAGLLVFFSRLDLLGLPAAFLLVYLVERKFDSASVRSASKIALVLAIGVGIYFIANQVIFGIAVPVSGAAKSAFQLSHLTDMEIWTGTLRLRWATTLPEFGSIPITLALGAGMVISALSIFRRKRLDDLHRVITVVTIAYLAQLSYLHLMLDLRSNSAWWHSLGFVLLAVESGMLVTWLINRFNLSRSDRLISTVAHGALILAIGFWLFVEPPSAQSNQSNRVALAAQIKSLPEGIIAMGDSAGAIGYYSDRRVVHLEGLVNGRDFIDYLKNGNIDQYLKDENISFLAAIQVDQTVTNTGYDSHLRREPFRLAWRGGVSKILVHEDEEVIHLDYPGGTAIVWKLVD